MNKFFTKWHNSTIWAVTLYRLGIINLFRIFFYRLRLKIDSNSAAAKVQVVPTQPFFNDINYPNGSEIAAKTVIHELKLFGWQSIGHESVPPDWHCNPLNGACIEMPERDWRQIPDFDPVVGDIKFIWETSRFDWVLAFAQRASAGEPDSLRKLNLWLADWSEKNPPFNGPNWKCGQEASIRVMHLAMAALILGQTEAPAKDLIALIRVHLQRIAPTIAYAIAQDNNHGTSEAAALFIGGSWLESLGQDGGKHWHRLGRKWLENRAARLIEPDGSFSQYSVNYHRVMLDTFSMVEVWRRHLGLPEFSACLLARVNAATRWLFSMVDPDCGDAPNLGANDGARLLPLTDTDYRDFRPSVQLAMALFAGERAYADDGPWNEQLTWLGLGLPDRVVTQIGNRIFDDGGYGLLKRGGCMALLRYPRFRFRPGHADALHVDLWKDGENLLRDAGTFSYNTDPEWLFYFPGTASHNTVQFDNRDQMPRLSRFLFGKWLKTESVLPLLENDVETTFGAALHDSKGAFHQRTLSLRNNRLIVQDEVSGFISRAVIRWRVRPGNWQVQGHAITDGEHCISVQANVPIARLELVGGWESRYYMQKTPVPVLEVEIHQPGMLTTDYCWGL